MESIHDPRYATIIDELFRLRKQLGINQEELAARLNQPQSYVSKVENRERRLDVLELFDWCKALDCDFESLLKTSGLYSSNRNLQDPPATYGSDKHSVVVPIPGKCVADASGIKISLASQNKEYSISLTNTSVQEYQLVEKYITEKFRMLNNGGGAKNREVIADCLTYAIQKMPNCNPSDVYHHVVYRTFLREYKKTDPNQSWVRAGGEAIELFLEVKYKDILATRGIVFKALINKDSKQAAITQMGLSHSISNSKLDIGLWGRLADGSEVIFGGIHVKASLAERVVDDIPCSQVMMSNSYISILFTFDAKSFPPPYGDLVNRGEFGSVQNPSDKRIYIENHGSFDAAFCYNTRIEPSPLNTKSGKRIFVSTMDNQEDALPDYINKKWIDFATNKNIQPLVNPNAKLL